MRCCLTPSPQRQPREGVAVLVGSGDGDDLGPEGDALGVGGKATCLHDDSDMTFSRNHDASSSVTGTPRRAASASTRR